MVLGMITCNYYMKIYDYQPQEGFSWPAMCDKWRAEFSADDFLALAADIRAMGYDGLEIWEPTFSHKLYTEAHAVQLRQKLDGLGFKMISYCIGGWGAGDVGQVEPAYRFAKALGASVVAGCVSLPDADVILPVVNQMGERYGIKYGIENHPRPNAESPDDVLSAMTPYPFVGANVDVGIYNMQGHDTLAAMDMFGDKIVHCHFKDTTKGGSGCLPIGDGDAPMAEVLEKLKAMKYQGMVSVEFEHHSDPGPGLIKSFEYIRARW